MPATTETSTYDAVLSTTLQNWAKGMADNITTSLFFYYMLKKSGSYMPVADLGERARYPLRYKNGNADTYHQYDPIDVTPIDGITTAFYNWHQLAVSISISRIEERKNSGEWAMLDLLDEKTNQAESGIIELFDKAFLQGNGINSASAITTQYTSPNNGSLFFSPLPLLIGHSPTANTIGSISGNVSDNGVNWWANQQAGGTNTNYASFLKDLSHMFNLCMKGVGGGPDTHIMDQSTEEFYEAALRASSRFTDYTRVDIPFENVTFRKQPVVWDEFVANSSGGTTVQSTTAGTWYMINSKFFQCKYDAQTNFTTTQFIRPIDQDAKSAQILWYGTMGVNNRRKHGVLDAINTTLTS